MSFPHTKESQEGSSLALLLFLGLVLTCSVDQLRSPFALGRQATRRRCALMCSNIPFVEVTAYQMSGVRPARGEGLHEHIPLLQTEKGCQRKRHRRAWLVTRKRNDPPDHTIETKKGANEWRQESTNAHDILLWIIVEASHQSSSTQEKHRVRSDGLMSGGCFFPCNARRHLSPTRLPGAPSSV